MASTQSKNKPSMPRAAYKGLGDEIWAQHSCLTRFVRDVTDEDIVGHIKAARDSLAEAGKLADRRGDGH